MARLVPILVVFIWLTSSSTGGQLLPISAQLQENTLLLAGSFIILALATIAFIRAKQRWHKAVAMLISASLILFSLALTNRANIGLGAGTVLMRREKHITVSIVPSVGVAASFMPRGSER